MWEDWGCTDVHRPRLLQRLCRDVLFVLHCNTFDDFVVPRVFIGQVNRFEIDPVHAIVIVMHLIECVPLSEAVVVVVDGRGILSDLKCKYINY